MFLVVLVEVVVTMMAVTSAIVSLTDLLIDPAVNRPLYTVFATVVLLLCYKRFLYNNKIETEKNKK